MSNKRSQAKEPRERMKRVAEMFYKEGLKQSVIAYKLNCSPTQVSRLLKEALRHGIVEIKVNAHDNSLMMVFDFPDEIRVPCEQYLLYFSQFLRDLGVEADASITEQAGQIVFAVTPNNKYEALEKIRSALDLYLQLPSNPIVSSSNESIAVQRLESTILRLRSDLKLAAAEVQAKDIAISAQRLMIDFQKYLLKGEVALRSQKEAQKLEDKETMLGGILAITSYKDKGVEINLAEIFRKLKRLFGGDDA